MELHCRVFSNKLNKFIYEVKEVDHTTFDTNTMTYDVVMKDGEKLYLHKETCLDEKLFIRDKNSSNELENYYIVNKNIPLLYSKEDFYNAQLVANFNMLHNEKTTEKSSEIGIISASTFVETVKSFREDKENTSIECEISAYDYYKNKLVTGKVLMKHIDIELLLMIRRKFEVE